MAKALIITEKPSVARDIAAALGGFREEDGYWESDDYVVTFAVGHLLELLEPEEVDEKYKRWVLDVLPILPERFQLKKKKGQSDRIRTIDKLAKRDDVDRVVNACDAGREGELIFRELAQFLDFQKPIHRLWLQSMTKGSIQKGFEELIPGREMEGLGQAAECRAWTDWLIGMNATRAITKRMASKREKVAWAAGRVQTPTLALLVGRELEVLAHVPRPYWQVKATFEHEGQPYEATWFDPGFKPGEDEDLRDDRIFDEARAEAVVQAVSGQAGEARETRKPSRESAPTLFDLTALQREANRRFGWSARRTLGAAQRLYEAHKLLTYPRTDSKCLPEDYRGNVDEILSNFAGASDAGAEYAPFARTLQEAGRLNEDKIFNDAGVSDHFAIVPTGNMPPADLSGDDKRLFDYVVRRFFGAFYPPAVWERVERTTTVAGESFRTRARTLREPGWRAVLPGGDDEVEERLPALLPGQDEASGVAIAGREATLEAEETRPPPRLSEARLLSLMENAGKNVEDEEAAAALQERGLGTPATRADIIENLILKGYAVRLGKSLRPTVKGIRLIDTLQRINVDRLASAQLTGEIERHLAEVEEGKRT
ncbi:MAG: DNA topoisomerase, partial [Myxococcota bacterium]|nr:DNA topoisomerase [Myxococcota bacterium]